MWSRKINLAFKVNLNWPAIIKYCRIVYCHSILYIVYYIYSIVLEIISFYYYGNYLVPGKVEDLRMFNAALLLYS